MRIVYAARSDVGRMRRANEDSYLVREPLFAVADGMGGHLAGDVASATAVEVLGRDAELELDERRLEEMVRDANAAIWEKAQADAQLRGMGTTCTLVWMEDSTAHLAHVGDSRAYLLREGALSQLTDDHTLVARMVREGRLEADEARSHPQRNVITRALGVDPEVDVDIFAIELQRGDRLLLCSDGLPSMVDDETIRTTLDEHGDLSVAADRLVDLANSRGGDDNITVLVLEAREGDGFASADERSPQTREDTTPAPRPSRGGRPFTWIFALLLLAGAAYGFARYSLANSWFVGVNGAGLVTIYRGVPDEVGGLGLKEVEEETTVAADDLPEFLKSDLEEGIRVDSLEEARSTVLGLEQRARESESQRVLDGGNG